jgi:hypothetical protein
MSVIYLTHEKHGYKVAISEDEAIADESNGWRRVHSTDKSATLSENMLSKRQPKQRSVLDAEIL